MTISAAERHIAKMPGLTHMQMQIMRNILDSATETAYQAGRMQTPDQTYEIFISKNSNHAKQQS